MMDIDLLNRDQKVEFVERVHELARLAEEWARSTTPLTDRELDRFQLLCNEFGVSESSLIARFQRKAREEAVNRTFNQPRVPTPEFFGQLPKRAPQPVAVPMSAHDRWVEEQAGRDQAYGDPVDVGRKAEAGLIAAIKTAGEKFDRENHIDPEGDMIIATPDELRSSVPAATIVEAAEKLMAEPKPAVTNRPPSPNATPRTKPRRGAVPDDPHGKIRLAPPETPAERTTSIAPVTDKKEA